MKKKTINLYFAIIAAFLFFAFPIKLIALNYTIIFTGTGASTSVQNVVVQNLTKGTTVTVPTGNVLYLTDVTTSIDKETEITNGISIYPNPMQTVSSVSFFVEQAGSTQISVFGLDGRKLIETNNVFIQGKNSFQLSVPNGVYALQVRGNGFSYKTKFISQLNSKIKPQVIFASNNINQMGKKPQKNKSAVTTMLYSLGDQLLYKGISGNHCTIVTDKPTESKTTNFEFVECKDADNNYYSVVKIGTQTWMAENLRTTKFLTGVNISNIYDGSEFASTSTAAYCDFGNQAANGLKYGRLYNGYAVIDSRQIAPLGWHVSRYEDWSILENYLTESGYNYDGTISGNKFAKSLAATTDWELNSEVGTIGKDLTKNNSTGFSALPGNLRNIGSFNSAGGNWWTSTDVPNQSNYLWYKNLNSYWNFQYTYYYPKTNGLSVRCVKNEIPTLSTTSLKLISNTTAISGGEVTDDGGAPVTARGVCWSVNHNPTIADNKTIDGSGKGVFSSNLANLTFGTNYYVRAYATNEVGTSYGNELYFLKIGDTYAGGIIFYLDATQQHGLVCPSTDQSTGIQWTISNFKSNATGTTIGTGLSNTDKIVSAQGSSGYAAKLCSDLILNGYDDWFLPSKEELSIMMSNLHVFVDNSGNLTNNGYWSSTEYNNSYAWCFYLNDSPIYSLKSSYFSVRAVRAF